MYTYRSNVKSLTDQLKEMCKITGSQSEIILTQISEIGELQGSLSHTVSQLASSSSGPVKENFIKEKPISERPFEYIKPRMLFKYHQILEPLPFPIIEIISQKVQNQHFAKILAIQNYHLFC